MLCRLEQELLTAGGTAGLGYTQKDPWRFGQRGATLEAMLFNLTAYSLSFFVVFASKQAISIAHGGISNPAFGKNKTVLFFFS
jgi:hypothetical protein